MTTLRTTAKPISNIAFPAITICGQGSISEVRSIKQATKIEKQTKLIIYELR